MLHHVISVKESKCWSERSDLIRLADSYKNVHRTELRHFRIEEMFGNLSQVWIFDQVFYQHVFSKTVKRLEKCIYAWIKVNTMYKLSLSPVCWRGPAVWTLHFMTTLVNNNLVYAACKMFELFPVNVMKL